MKNKDKKTVFLVQIEEDCLKIIKCLSCFSAQAEFICIELPKISSSQELKKALIKEGFKANEIIASLPRNQVTCRFLRLPGKHPEELEKIARLQASRYLPYPAEELVTAYDILATDKEGFSEVILTICHKNSLAEYLNLLVDKPQCAKLGIILSSYGICNLFHHLKPQESEIVMLVDPDNQQTELVVTGKGKMLFSRSVKIGRETPGWEGLLSTEIRKTSDVFIKETLGEPIKRVIILGVSDLTQESLLKIEKEAGMTIEFLNYAKALNLKMAARGLSLDTRHSFASLIGLGLKNLPDALNILPERVKEDKLNLSRSQERLKSAILIAGIILVFFLGMVKNLENKERYLQKLKKQLSDITQEALPLEGIEKRFRLIASKADRKDSPLDVFYEVHRLMPAEISLVNLSYEEERSVLLHGTTTDMQGVFKLISALEKSPAFAQFNIKIRFATRKKIQSGEIIDFEIGCAR